MDFILKGMAQGLIWALLALGVFISYRILDFADLSCEGTITLGASLASMLLTKGANPVLAILLSFAAGCVAGALTGFLHTKLKIPPILSGILTMTALFSVNLHIMGSANLQLNSVKTLYTSLTAALSINKTYLSLIIGTLVCLAVMGALYWFFGTELGASIRATGINERMCRAQGIDTDMTKIIGLALSNGLIALSGAFICQYQGYSNINLGVGSIVIGLASIIIGEAIFSKAKNFFLTLTGIVVGAVIYRVVIAVVLYFDMPTEDVKIMTAFVVVAALFITKYANKLGKRHHILGATGQAPANEARSDAAVREKGGNTDE
ncbi:MAG: ABC transporter permease [Clostridia bacterium]|nr:ABC transporter permease [Clostridia bacterium]